jgi:hypothetical protein
MLLHYNIFSKNVNPLLYHNYFEFYNIFYPFIFFSLKMSIHMLQSKRLFWVYNFWCWYLNVLTPFLLFFKKKMRQVNFPDKIKSPNKI